MWAVSSSGLTSALMRLSSPMASAFSSHASSSLALRPPPRCAFDFSTVVVSAPAFTDISIPPLLYLMPRERVTVSGRTLSRVLKPEGRLLCTLSTPLSRSFLEQVAVFLQRNIAFFGRRRIDGRKFVPPVPGSAGVDHGTAVGIVACRLGRRLDPRIERRRPGIVNNIDRSGRIGAGNQRPDDLLQVRHVDIIVDNDGITAAIGTDVTH